MSQLSLEGDTFLVLKENDILSDRLYSSVEKMAKFRNIVVQHYDKVDAEIVVAILKKDLKDLTGFRDAIASFLKSEKSFVSSALCFNQLGPYALPDGL
jgi:uncharacterized protein YutE (UPF0331/DUF86 family)